MRRAPSGLCLQHVSPQRYLSERPAHGARLVAADEIRERVDRVAHGMEATRTLRPRNRMHRTVERAFGERSGSRRPLEIVEHRPKPEPGRCLRHRPHPPAHDDAGQLATDLPGFHQRAIAA